MWETLFTAYLRYLRKAVAVQHDRPSGEHDRFAPRVAQRTDMICTGPIMVSGILLSFFMNGTYAGVYAYTPEVFPTDVRATGTGLASSIGRLGAIAAPILVGYVYPLLGFAGVFGATTLVLLTGAIAVVLMGVPTRGRSLEDIAAGQVEQ
jgi:nitrate/nitrite transporter NarK